MTTNPLVPLLPEEIAACYAVNASYCEDNPGAADWNVRHERAAMFADLLPDSPLEVQVRQYEAAA